ncbi:M3 family metallopeptidase [Bernardetia sp. MNP-M8]|uniref:M3 family metallopeptidase n=1 Tax=Bernardetia sp. MNP-M8 TaxID=3127470 RepID=UPI0030D28E3C
MESYFEFFYSSPNFEEIDAKSIRYITDKIIRKSDATLAVILGGDTQTFEMKMEKWDELTHKLSSISGIIFLLAHTSSDEKVYKQANQSVQVLQRYGNSLSLNEELYKAIKKYSQSDDARWLKGYKKKFIKETVGEFERNGFALVQQDRDILRTMKDQLSDLSNEFSRNIAEHQDQIIISEDDIEGLPEDYKNRHRMENGMYKITLDSPSYRPFMRYAKNEKYRKELYIKYLNRGNPKNTGVLIKTIALRKQMANLLGYKTYAQYVIEERMAKTPDTVWSFEEELTKKVKPKAEKDYKELLSIAEGKEELQGWETGYYNNILLEKNYNLNSEEVKQYFELNNVFKGIFNICKNLFGIDFIKMYHHSVWHEDVIVYEVRKKNKVVGKMYLDLYPRPNKYSHAACFGLVSGRETERGYQTPHTALVCNFPPSTSDSPSLLSHDQVTTVFHEFGHGLHQLLTQSPLAAFAGTNVARDFVEVPSQLFENWAWDYDILKEFALHHKTGEVLPKELFDKMVAAKNVGSGLFTLQQILYGTFDLTLHDTYDPLVDASPNELFNTLQRQITLTPPVEETDFPSGFGHLMGYAAGYYGYLWAKVYAEDMFSVFEKAGLLNPKVGKMYVDKVLSKGGSEDEMSQIKSFLKREPKQEAFLKSLGL